MAAGAGRVGLDVEVQVVEETAVVVVGGGQAGIAASEHLRAHGVEHVVLERARIAESWRTARWDSLVTNGPAWHDRFPGRQHECDGDAYVTKDQVADYFAAYAEAVSAPVRCGVEVQRVRRRSGRTGFEVATSAGDLVARHIVAATGAFQVPVVPPLVPADAGVLQLHSSAYRNPDQLPPGAVLVVGSGSSGAQIADELCRAGRQVFLSVSSHGRPPRRYRGRDFVWWLGVMGLWDAVAAPGAKNVTISVSGARGGRTVDFRDLAAAGVVLLGRTTGWRDGCLQFADDLEQSVTAGDANHLSLLAAADAHAERNGLDLPEEPEAHVLTPLPGAVRRPPRELDLATASISTVLWATGFTRDDSWLQVDAFDERGGVRHHLGASSEPGVYFLGLPWQSRRSSSFIFGVWQDARHVADRIAVQEGYLSHGQDG